MINRKVMSIDTVVWQKRQEITKNQSMYVCDLYHVKSEESITGFLFVASDLYS